MVCAGKTGLRHYARIAGVAACLLMMPTAALADRCLPLPARLFASRLGLYGFKLAGSTGRYFMLLQSGQERLVWESRLINVPAAVYVADNRRNVVTTDTACKFGYEHAVVVYGDGGGILADYHLDDLLTGAEIRDHVEASISSRHWTRNATLGFDGAGDFAIVLPWGKTLRFSLRTGKLTAH